MIRRAPEIVLDNGNVLFQRGPGTVVEVNKDGKAVWEYIAKPAGDYKGAIEAISDYRPGDICVTNDPYSGYVCTHAPDMHLWMPIFEGDSVVAAFSRATDAVRAAGGAGAGRKRVGLPDPTGRPERVELPL